MAIRIFRCEHCDHKMRLGGDCCGWCNEYKKPYQRMYFYVVPLVLILFTAPNFLSL